MKPHHTELLYQQLETEAEYDEALQKAASKVRRAAFQLQEAENGLTGIAKFAPRWTGIGSTARTRINEARERLHSAKREVANIQRQVWDTQNALDVLMFNQLKHGEDEELRKSEDMRGFYPMARKRIEVFQTCVFNFLKSLGQTRGAMSATYNVTTKEYSEAAKQRVQEAIKEARKLDAALEDLAELSKEFKRKSRGTRYSKIDIPTFEHVGYEKFVRDTIKKPIAQAQMAFEHTLKGCEQLKDEGIEFAYEQVDHAESLHKELTNELVRKAWQKLQTSHLSK